MIKRKLDDKLGLQNNLNDISFVLNKSISSMKKSGIILIQKINEEDRMKESIVKIQSFVRKFLYKKALVFKNILLMKQKYKKQLIKVKSILIKSLIRNKIKKLILLIKNQNSETFKEYRNYCAIIIQKNFKGYRERTNYKKAIQKKHYLLKKILSIIKGWKIRKIMKDEKIVKLKEEIHKIGIQIYQTKNPSFLRTYFKHHPDFLNMKRKQKIIELISLINAFYYTFEGVLRRQFVSKCANKNLEKFNTSSLNKNLYAAIQKNDLTRSNYLNPKESRKQIKINPNNMKSMKNSDNLTKIWNNNNNMLLNSLSKPIKLISNQKNKKMKISSPSQEHMNNLKNIGNFTSRNKNLLERIKSVGLNEKVYLDKKIYNCIINLDKNFDSNFSLSQNNNKILSNFIKYINKDKMTIEIQPFLKRKSKQMEIMKHLDWKNVPNKVECWNTNQRTSKSNSKAITKKVDQRNDKEKELNPLEILSLSQNPKLNSQIINLIEYDATFRYKKLFNQYFCLHSVEEVPNTYFKKINKKTKIPSLYYKSRFLTNYNEDSYLVF